MESFDKALEIDPRDPDAWYNRGVVSSELGRTEEALKSYDKAIKIDPRHSYAWYNKIVTLAKLGRNKEATESVRKVIEIWRALQEIRPRLIRIATTQHHWVRVCLAQLNVPLEPIHLSEEFGYVLRNEEKDKVKTKVFEALKVANDNHVNIICFPELCVAEDWIEDVKNQYKNIIVVFGTFYKKSYNDCPVIVNGHVFHLQKRNPSPPFETEVISGKQMKRGKKSTDIFQTEYGRFAVLICWDYVQEAHTILHNSDEGISGVDFIIVPQYNGSVKQFQQQANLDCRRANCPYILQINTWKVLGKKAGGTCIIGMDNNDALKRYKVEGFKPKDSIDYKLIETKQESIVIVDLDIKRKGAPVPTSDPKMKLIGRYLFKNSTWEKCEI